MKLEPGDIILTSKDSFIAQFMRNFQDDPVVYGHCMMVANDGYVIETGFYGIKKITIDQFLKERKHFKVIRPTCLTNMQLQDVVGVASLLVGLKYSFKRMFLQLLDHLFFTNFFTSLDKDRQNQVCSTVVSYSYYVACGIKFNDVEWFSVEPDDIDDDFIKNHNKWYLVGVK